MDKFNWMSFLSVFSVGVLTSAVAAWLSRGGKERRALIMAAIATALTSAGLYGIPAVMTAYWPAIVALSLGIVGWVWALRRSSTASTPPITPPVAQADRLVNRGQFLVVPECPTPIVNVQEGREPTLLGLGLSAINLSTEPVVVESITLSVFGNNQGMVSDRVVMPKASIAPDRPTPVSLGTIALSDEVARRLRKEPASDCISIHAQLTLHLSGWSKPSISADLTTWANVVRDQAIRTERAPPATSIDIKGSRVGGDVIGGDKKR